MKTLLLIPLLLLAGEVYAENQEMFRMICL
jgi:hypothetical protein